MDILDFCKNNEIFNHFSQPKKMTIKQILKLCRKYNISDVVFLFSDIAGKPRGVTIKTHKIASTIETGTTVDGLSIKGFIRKDEKSMFAKPDLDSFFLLPWRKNHIGNVGCFICDIVLPDGTPFEGDSRYILKRALKKAENMGYKYIIAPEYEFYLFQANKNGEPILDKDDRPIPIDREGYFGVIEDNGEECRREILDVLNKMGIGTHLIDSEKSHHEVGPGQQEIGLSHGDALKIADQIILVKMVIKAIAKKYGFYASFMPKPFENEAGSGTHFHQNLTNLQGQNIFHCENGLYKLSQTGLNFTAGQLKYSPEFLAILACEVNSYERLVPGYEAPVYITLSENSRSALIKIFSFTSKSSRIEIRCADPNCNPHLAATVLLVSGLEGINKKLDPPKTIKKNIFKMSPQERKDLSIESLPCSSLWEALKSFEKSELVKNALGEHAFHMFLDLKKNEWENDGHYITQKQYKRSL